MSAFEPYANEADALMIGNLQLENRLDRISLYGDLALTKDKLGLARAMMLKRIIDAAIAELEATPDLPNMLPVPSKPASIANPFH